jgi:Tfp pilus assembly protein PilO
MVNKIVGFKVLILPLAAAFLVMMSVLYIKPAYDEMQLLKTAQAEKKQQLGDLQKQSQKLEELKKQWNSMASEKSLIEGALPAQSYTENYLAELDGRVNRSGVLLSGINLDENSSPGCLSVTPAVSLDAPSPSSTAAVDSASQLGSSAASSSLNPAPQNCLKTVSVKLTVSGSWDQMINFFKYLEDTNRIANITLVSLSASNQSEQNQQSSDVLLNGGVSLSVFYKEKNMAGSPSSVNSLSSGKGFEEKVIKKLNEVIFAPYVAPNVSTSGERNIFK